MRPLAEHHPRQIGDINARHLNAIVDAYSATLRLVAEGCVVRRIDIDATGPLITIDPPPSSMTVPAQGMTRLAGQERRHAAYAGAVIEWEVA